MQLRLVDILNYLADWLIFLNLRHLLQNLGKCVNFLSFQCNYGNVYVSGKGGY